MAKTNLGNVLPTIQKFLSGSGTYNRPSGVKYIKVRMVGGGGGGGYAGAGHDAVANTGSGGGGGGTANASSFLNGAGGSAGGYVEAIISSPSATYAYSIGAGGTAGTAGTSGLAGGVGGSGVVIVEEFY